MAHLECGVPTALLLLLLCLGAAQLPHGADAFEIALPSGSGLVVRIRPVFQPLLQKTCHIIVSRRSNTVLTIKSGDKVDVSFSCQNPKDYFVIDIQKNIDCMSGPCPFGEVQLQPAISALPTLNRTYTWDVKANKRIGLELQFSLPRLRQIDPEESCPDGVTHTISGHIDATTVKIGTFCSNGTVSRIKMQEGVKMALHLPWFLDRNVSGFSIANRSSIKRLCIIESVFEGEGSATLMSANYPKGFPEDELMTWQFIVPTHLQASVYFLQFNVSNCEKKEERVEYYKPGSNNPEVLKLQDKQPVDMAGNFNLSLQGCDQDAQNPGVLRLQFQVLVQRPQNESNQTYLVDLSNEQAMSITIEPRPRPRPLRLNHKPEKDCLVCLEPRECYHNITFTPGSKHKIFFLCDNLTRLWMNAEKTLSCMEPRHCHRRRPFPLQLPENIFHLPVQLHDFSWKLLVPENSLSLALAPVQKLQQNTYERPCNTSFSYLVASAIPGQNQHLGTFCSGGSIERIQVKQNISVTLRTFGPNFQQDASRQPLSVSYIPYLKAEESIFTVTPDSNSKVYLRTPNWDWGMPPLTSVSWNISVPRDQQACLTFLKERSKVVCQSKRALMIIQEQQTHMEEIFSLEEDALPKPSFYHRNFWVNISNCIPMSGKQLDLLFWVTLTPRTMDLTIIIIAVVGGAFLLFAFGLIICCVKKKKKKINKGPPVGVYNGHVNTQMPMQPPKFHKGRKDNESHVYAVIEDTMVYGHLLQESNGSFHQPEVDTYWPFQGPTGDCPPSPPLTISRTPTKKLTSDEPSPGYESDPYTFSHPNNGEVSLGTTHVPLLDAQEAEEPVQ